MYQAWVALYANMNSKTYISFEDFKERCKSEETKTTDITYEEVEHVMDDVVRRYESRGEK